MKLSAKTEYACIAMVQLAKEYGNSDPLLIRRIADEHGISARFWCRFYCSPIGRHWWRVCVARWADINSRDTRPKSLSEVVDAMEGHKRPVTHAGRKTSLVRSLLRLCRELDEMQRDRVGQITLANFVEQDNQRDPI
jgi:Rrf2 family cysteine metabolism transcriptional repressor